MDSEVIGAIGPVLHQLEPSQSHFAMGVVDNRDGTKRDMKVTPCDLLAAHILKISGGKIHEIEAMGFTLPLNLRNGERVSAGDARRATG